MDWISSFSMEVFYAGALIWASAISALDTATLCKEAWDVAPYLFWLIWQAHKSLTEASTQTDFLLNPWSVLYQSGFLLQIENFNTWEIPPTLGQYQRTGEDIEFKYLKSKKWPTSHPWASLEFNPIHSLTHFEGWFQLFSFEPLCRHCLWMLFWPLCVLLRREVCEVFWSVEFVGRRPLPHWTRCCHLSSPCQLQPH